jgi:hypothetical protein
VPGQALLVKPVGYAHVECDHHHAAVFRFPLEMLVAQPEELCSHSWQNAMGCVFLQAARKNDESRSFGNVERQVHRANNDFRYVIVVDEDQGAGRRWKCLQQQKSGESDRCQYAPLAN